MSFIVNPFHRPSRAGGAWFYAGPVTSYPNADDSTRLAEPRLCHGKHIPGCRIFHVPRENSSMATEVAIDDWKEFEAGDTKDQVMVFQYKGKFIAVNHECPHSSYSLSNGTPFDIEDFGVVLSSGIICPKHSWSFDLHTGKADRGSYKLQIWEVQRRSGETESAVEEIWVRRKQRIG